MATLLEVYYNKKLDSDHKMETGSLNPAQMWEYQELLYRIEVLSVCQMLIKSSPKSTDTTQLVPHYQIMDAYLETLMNERKNGADKELPPDFCETALDSLRRIADDNRKRFSSFTPGNDNEAYKKEVFATLQTVLTAWIQYRQTHTYINTGVSQ